MDKFFPFLTSLINASWTFARSVETEVRGHPVRDMAILFGLLFASLAIGLLLASIAWCCLHIWGYRKVPLAYKRLDDDEARRSKQLSPSRRTFHGIRDFDQPPRAQIVPSRSPPKSKADHFLSTADKLKKSQETPVVVQTITPSRPSLPRLGDEAREIEWRNRFRRKHQEYDAARKADLAKQRAKSVEEPAWQKKARDIAAEREARAARLAAASERRGARRVRWPRAPPERLQMGMSGVALAVDLESLGLSTEDALQKRHTQLNTLPRRAPSLQSVVVIVTRAWTNSSDGVELSVYGNEDNALTTLRSLGALARFGGHREVREPSCLVQLTKVPMETALAICDVWDVPPWEAEGGILDSMTPSHNQVEGNAASMAAAKSGDKELASICAAADHWRKWLKLERDRHTRVFRSTSPLSHVSTRQSAAKTRSDSSPNSYRSPPRSSSWMQGGGFSCKLSCSDSSSTMPLPVPDNLLDRERRKWAAPVASNGMQVLSTAPPPDPDNLLDRERRKWAAPVASNGMQVLSTAPPPDPDNLLDRERRKWAAPVASNGMQVLSTAPPPDPDNLLDRERRKWAAPVASNGMQVLSTAPRPDPDNLLDRERRKWAAPVASNGMQVLSTAPRPDPDNLLDRERRKWAAPICSPMRSPMRSPSSRQPRPSASSPGSTRSCVQCTQLFNDNVLISQSPPSR